MHLLLLGLLYALGQVSSRRVLHHDVQFHLCSPVDLSELHDVFMVQHLQDLGLFEGGLLLLRSHVRQVYLLYDPLVQSLFVLNQEGSAIGACA